MVKIEENKKKNNIQPDVVQEESYERKMKRMGDKVDYLIWG